MYLNNFKNNEDIVDSFKSWNFPQSVENITRDLEGSEVLLAWYGDGSYSGDAFVLYRKEGKLYEVNGGHCSCHGLEGQWDPEETTWEALSKRDISDWYEGGKEATEALKTLVSENWQSQKV